MEDPERRRRRDVTYLRSRLVTETDPLSAFLSLILDLEELCKLFSLKMNNKHLFYTLQISICSFCLKRVEEEVERARQPLIDVTK